MSKRVMLMGRSGCGKTTLIQALEDVPQVYKKTQSIDYGKYLIDTPGEYTQVLSLGRALAIYAYEVDIVAMLAAATEDHSLYAPNITPHVNREVIGVVTKCDIPGGWPDTAAGWLRTAGCKKIFRVSARSGEGIDELRAYLNS